MSERNPDNIQVASQEVKFNGFIFRVESRKFTDGLTREGVYKQGAVFVLAVKPNGDVMFVEEFRHIVGERVAQPIAGLIDPGENPAQAAQREMQEEAKVKAGRLVPLSGQLFVSSGFTDETAHYFLAFDLEDSALDADTEEDIKVLTLPFSELLRAARGQGSQIQITSLHLWAAVLAAHDYFVYNQIPIPGVVGAARKKGAGRAVAAAIVEIGQAVIQAARTVVAGTKDRPVQIEAPSSWNRSEVDAAMQRLGLKGVRTYQHGKVWAVEIPQSAAWAIMRVFGYEDDRVTRVRSTLQSEESARAYVRFLSKHGHKEALYGRITEGTGTRWHITVPEMQAPQIEQLLTLHKRELQRFQ